MYAEIDRLSLAVSIKELLISKGFTKSEDIIKTDLVEITSRLGIDVDVAKLVQNAAAKKLQLSQDIRSSNRAADT
jgi:predicted DsbA family dithiol-disulfide isomerase